jgi:predicted O-methyltransferase YrrM
MVENANKMLRELRRTAKEDGIPIMSDKGIEYLTSFIVKNNINSVLEIGTAVGYSAISMALVNPKLKVVTIERDESRYMEAIKNVKKFDLEDRITCIFNDALSVKLDDKFDLIFIDAAKGQNINFFERFAPNLETKGYIITDNMKFHGYVDMPEEEIKNRNLRGLVRKIKDYKTYLEENTKYETEFSDVGDGLAITSPKID